MGKKKSLKEHVTSSKIVLTRRAQGGYIDKSGKIYSPAEGTKLLMENKASMSQWHGGKKNKGSYEGGQYAGGRVKGRKNLEKLDNGNVRNEHGVEFTPADKKRLEREVNKNNATRMKMLESEGKLPRMKGGTDTGDKVKSLQLMGKESDFILSRKSKSLQQFKSREDFEIYMDNLTRVNSPTYLDDRTRDYKRNHMKALENVFGDDAKDVIMKIRMMKPEDYRKLLQSDEDMEISYIYDPSQLSAKLNQIRASLNMTLKEEYIEDV